MLAYSVNPSCLRVRTESIISILDWKLEKQKEPQKLLTKVSLNKGIPKMRSLPPVHLHRDVYEDVDTPLMKLRHLSNQDTASSLLHT